MRVSGLGLECVLDLLIDREPLGPARRCVGAALDVAREKLDARQQAAHAAHVVVAVAAHLVADAVEDQRAIMERLERLQDLLELERRAFLVGPERRRHDAVGAEHDRPAAACAAAWLAKPRLGRFKMNGQGRGADSQVADELASVARWSHVISPLE